ncbi:unnamed protein product [Calypogeia fissa]
MVGVDRVDGGRVMDDSYGNYVLGSHGRAVPTPHLRLSNSGGRGPYQNRYRQGGLPQQQQQQPRGQKSAYNNESRTSTTRTWRATGGARSTTSPARERLAGASSTRATRPEPRQGPGDLHEGRGASTPGRGGIGSNRLGRICMEEGSSPATAQSHDCRAHSGGEMCDRAESPHRGDRPRWAVAEAPIVIGSQNVYDLDESLQLEDFWMNDRTHPESLRRIDSTFSSSSLNGRSGGGVDSSAGVQQGRGSRMHGAERNMLNASRSYGEGSQDVRGAPIHRRKEAATSSRWEWMGGGASSRGGEFDSRPGSSSGDSVTLNENMGRPFSHREGGKRDYHLGAEGSSAAAGQGTRRAPIPSLVESDSAGALWKAKKSQVPQLVQELEEKLTRGTVECMICYDMVGRGSPVWSCASCYAIFHLSCIRKWARAPTSADFSVSSSNNSFNGNWRCPGCQTVEFISAKDLRYYCFCGQVENPSVDHYITPHSCGGPCKKALDKSKVKRCNHYCTMQCHPGPCPPCAANAPSESCPCGKKTFTRRCGEQTAIGSCGNVCGRRLLCGRHSCSRICHEGPCDSCNVEVKTQCFCGVKQELLLCGRVEIQGELDFEKGLFSCASPCSRILSCGNHKCEEKCHPGQCGECELAPSKLETCPCGKKKLQELVGNGRGRKSCLDVVPICSQGWGGSHSRATPETEMILSRLPAPLQPYNGNEKIPLGQRKIQCDDECGKLEKRRLLADAFGVDYYGDAQLGGDNEILGSDILAEMLRRDPQWVLSVEERFKTLLLGPKGSGGIKVHVFCAMSKEKRDIISQLAERWSLSVSNSGREPRRFPIVHVTNKSKVPYLKLISKTPLPTAGQQIPPPFNAAVDMEPGLVVAFFDVPREVDMSSLVLRFAGECELVWLNDKIALAIFGDAARAATALRRVDHTSAYKGAISLPGSAIHSSSKVGGAWGQAVGGTYAAAKPAAKKKAVQLHESSPWVDDAWGEVGKKGTVAWQIKGSNPITTSKNPWGALEQIKPSVNAEGIKGCFVSGQSSSPVPAKAGESSAQGERGRHIRPPTTADADKQVGTSKAVSQLCALSLSKNATTSSGSNDNNDDDDWEKLLD